MKPDNAEGKEMLAQKVPQRTIDVILAGLQEARQEILQADAFRSFILILLAAAIIWLYSMKWQIFGSKSGKNIVIGSILVLVLFDQVSVVKRYLTDRNFEPKRIESYDATEADNYILRDPDPDYRVLNLSLERNSPSAPYNDASTSYFHKSIGGYHGAKIRRFQELAEKYLYEETSILIQNTDKGQGQMMLPMIQNAKKLGVLNMMNCKYIITGQDSSGVLRNPYALGHAWFVKGVKTVLNADDELASLNGFNPGDTAVIDIGPKHPDFKKYMEGYTPAPDAAASIKQDIYKPNYLKYSTNASTEQFAVFSEVYYDNGLGWEATIDGKPAPHIRVNYLLRGMRIPAGHHTIEFRFMPQSFVKGEKAGLICSLIMLAGLIGSAGWEIYRGRKKEDVPPPAES